jgi:hypothetical protein
MKKMKRIVSMSLAASILSSSMVGIAVPSDSVIIGSKVFMIDQLEDEAILEEINNAIMESDDIFYNIDGITGDEFIGIDDKQVMTEEQKTNVGKVTIIDVKGLNIEMESFEAEKGSVVVSNKQELEKYVKHDLVESIELKEEIDLGEEALKIEKPIKIKLNGKKIKGNVEIKVKKAEDKVEIEDDGNGGIEGEVKVETENAEVVLDAKVKKVSAEKPFKLVAKENAKIEEITEEVKAKIEVKKEDGAAASEEKVKEVFGKKPEKKPDTRPTRPVYVTNAPVGRSITVEYSFIEGNAEPKNDVNLDEIFTDRNGDKLTYSILRHDGIGKIVHNGMYGGSDEEDNYEGMTRFFYRPVLEEENAEFGKIVTVFVTANDGVNTSSPVAIKFKCPDRPKEPIVEAVSDRLEQFEDAKFNLQYIVNRNTGELLDGDYYVGMGAEEYGPMIQKQVRFSQGEAELLVDGSKFVVHGETNLIFEISTEENPEYGEGHRFRRRPVFEKAVPVEWGELKDAPAGEEEAPLRVAVGERKAIPVLELDDGPRLSEGESERLEFGEPFGRFERPVDSSVVATLETMVNIEKSTNHAPEFNPSGNKFTVFAGLENEIELSNAFTDADGDKLDIKILDEAREDSEIDFTAYSMKDGDTALFTPSVDDIGKTKTFPFEAFDGKQYSEVSPITISIVSKEDMIKALTDKIAGLSPYVLNEEEYDTSKSLLYDIDSIVATAKNVGVTDEELSKIEGYGKIENVKADVKEFEEDLDGANDFEKSLSQILDREESIIINEETLAVENDDEISGLIVVYESLSERAQNLVETGYREAYDNLKTDYLDALDAYETQLDDVIDRMNEMYAGYRLENIDNVQLAILNSLNEMKARFEAIPAELKSDLDEEYQAIVDKFYGAIEALNAKKQMKLDEIEKLMAVYDEDFTRENYNELMNRVEANNANIEQITRELNLLPEESKIYTDAYRNKHNEFRAFLEDLSQIEHVVNLINGGITEANHIYNLPNIKSAIEIYENLGERAKNLLTEAELQDIKRTVTAFNKLKAELIAQIEELVAGFTYELNPETIEEVFARHQQISQEMDGLPNVEEFLTESEFNSIEGVTAFMEAGRVIGRYKMDRNSAEEVVNELKVYYSDSKFTVTSVNVIIIKNILGQYDAQSDDVKSVYTAEENAVVEGARAAVSEFEAEAKLKAIEEITSIVALVNTEWVEVTLLNLSSVEKTYADKRGQVDSKIRAFSISDDELNSIEGYLEFIGHSEEIEEGKAMRSKAGDFSHQLILLTAEIDFVVNSENVESVDALIARYNEFSDKEKTYLSPSDKTLYDSVVVKREAYTPA